MRCRHPGRRDRQRQRCHALPRTGPPRRQRLRHRAGQAARHRAHDLQPVLGDGGCAVGRIIAVVGAKGGVGASTVAHNVAWTIARDLALDSVVIDLDLAFGTASLDYNQDPVQGIANAVFRRIGPTAPSWSACWQSAATASACWPRRLRSIRSTISARTPSTRSSIRCA